jgi:eukaryotic-like serine/threonine-protein kinase
MSQRSSSSTDPLEASGYRTVRHIAEGGGGVIYEAEHIALRKRVAVKVLRRDAAGATMEERMRVEAQVLARLRSPHLVEVSDFGRTSDGRPFYVMELLQGVTLLGELRRRGCLPPHEAVGYVRQLLKGLDVAHWAGIVHRDIKLENLFLVEGPDGTRVVKILDFGLAKVLPNTTHVEPPAMRTSEGTILGTPRTMAPEQALGREVGPPADLYAAGIVLYELLTGSDPFKHVLGTLPLLRAAVSEDPRLPSAVASQPIEPALEDVVMRALAKRPEDRYASAKDLSAALAHAMELAGLVETPPAWPAGVPAPGASLSLTLALVLCAAALSTLAAFWLTRIP